MQMLETEESTAIVDGPLASHICEGYGSCYDNERLDCLNQATMLSIRV
uniref:Uncharacterized protein n=1 Tax=Rhizophora mucronata TaxID=61149 RepID=A0A2P2PTE7_RHIMU